MLTNRPKNERTVSYQDVVPEARAFHPFGGKCLLGAVPKYSSS